jgi:RNA polymerase sigma-70 factor (ECF subfamily)
VTLYIRSLVFAQSDVDDLVQDVAAKAWERLDTYDPQRPFEAWLITLARYEVLSYFKARKRDRLVLDEHVAERVADTMQSMTDRNELFTLDALERCLARVRPDDRELLRQRFDLNKTGEAIAAALKVSGATVSRRLARIYAGLLVCVKSAMRQEGLR